MLINASQPEEVRVALVDGQRLYDLDIENRGREQKKASIYKAKITRVEPSLEAAFVEFGSERHGFLPLKDTSRSYFKKTEGGGKPNIADVLSEGQELIVQVDKEERGNKGAALTTFVSLAGRYLVLMPNNPRAGGVSRRIEGEERDLLRQALSKLQIPEGMGVIVRTAGIDRSQEELQWDLDYLLQLWDAVQRASETERTPALLYQENNVVLRAIRDYLRSDVGEVLIDQAEAFAEASAFIEQVMPNYKDRIKHYDDPIPLFSRYQIESQIESAFQHEVKLPSGGSLVIDPTEALVSIDINSARATKGADIEETALNTNLEAAEELARQLRLRDVGGLIVIDFIDMTNSRNQRSVENKMREVLDADRARVQTSRISRFGLMEMSRQRLRPSLEEITTEVCPRCSGQGRIRDTKSLALTILRVMEEEALKEKSSIVRAIVPMNVASYLLNEKRRDVAEIEQRTGIHVVIVPSAQLETPQYEIQRIREDNAAAEMGVASYELAEAPPVEETTTRRSDAQKPRPFQEPAVKSITPATPAPTPQAKPEPQQAEAAESKPQQETPARTGGFFKRLMGSLMGEASTETEPAKPAKAAEPKRTEGRRQPPRKRGPRQNDQQRRGGRGQGSGEQRRDGGDRNERGRRGNRDGRDGRGGREGREGRESRDNRGDRGRREQSGRGRDGGGRGGERGAERGAERKPEGARRDERSSARREDRPPRDDNRDAGESKRRQPRENNRAPRSDQAERPPRRERVAAQPAEPRVPEDLEASKRRPRRDRSAIAQSDQAPARPSRPAPRAEAAGESALQQATAGEAQASQPSPAPRPESTERAANDPRGRPAASAGITGSAQETVVTEAPPPTPPKEQVAQATPVAPEATPVAPEATPVAPEKKPVEPETKSSEPEPKQPEPETKSKEPEVKQPEPEVKPPEPETKSKEPAAQEPPKEETPVVEAGRAANDPREVRRRQREAELKQDG
jgi:ribonuclease E